MEKRQPGPGIRRKRGTRSMRGGERMGRRKRKKKKKKREGMRRARAEFNISAVFL